MVRNDGMRRNDQIEIVEAAYAIGAPHETWQHRLTELVARQWDGEAISFVYDASDPHAPKRESLIMLMSEDKCAAYERLSSGPWTPDYIRGLFHRGPHLFNLYELMAELGTTAQEWEALKPIRDKAPDFDFDLFSHAVRTLDPSHRGVIFFTSARPITERIRRVWGQLAAHIGIAYRLRRQLADAPCPSDELLGEAIVDLEGRCQHAEGEARSADARELLRAATRAVMRARGSLRARDPDEALELWRGLVDGRWSLIDRFDADGKHYLVAHRNPPQVRDHRALSRREAEVAAYLAMGLSNKEIGYALGIAITTTSDHISSIERKLGVGSRSELVRLLAALLSVGASDVSSAAPV
jgi:DNA-binding CsgD family transcriptional regulator